MNRFAGTPPTGCNPRREEAQSGRPGETRRCFARVAPCFGDDRRRQPYRSGVTHRCRPATRRRQAPPRGDRAMAKGELRAKLARSNKKRTPEGGQRRQQGCRKARPTRACAHPQPAAWGVEPKAGPAGRIVDSCCMKDRKIDAGEAGGSEPPRRLSGRRCGAHCARRIASPETLPWLGALPHLKCSPGRSHWEHWNEEGKHDGTRRTG